MSKDSIRVIYEALDTLELPVLVNLEELKKQYKYLAKKNHPDFCEDLDKMTKINEAYEIIKSYMVNYRFSFSEEEIRKQFPRDTHAYKFKF